MWVLGEVERGRVGDAVEERAVEQEGTAVAGEIDGRGDGWGLEGEAGGRVDGGGGGDLAGIDVKFE